MNFFERLLLLWVYRQTPQKAFMETHVLVLKAARRCAYDLKHAAGQLSHKDPELSKHFYSRARMWLNIFQPTGGKDYRHELHSELSQLETKLSVVRDILKKHGIEDPTAEDDISF